MYGNHLKQKVYLRETFKTELLFLTDTEKNKAHGYCKMFAPKMPQEHKIKLLVNYTDNQKPG